MRLGDLDALKKSLDFVYDYDYIGSRSKEGIASDIIEAIDNAPTIEEKSYAMGYQDGVEDEALDIRPHGKWEFFSIGDNQYTRCSLCKDEHIGEDTDLDWWYDNFKYCPKCGAYMWKETQK